MRRIPGSATPGIAAGCDGAAGDLDAGAGVGRRERAERYLLSIEPEIAIACRTSKSMRTRWLASGAEFYLRTNSGRTDGGEIARWQPARLPRRAHDHTRDGFHESSFRKGPIWATADPKFASAIPRLHRWRSMSMAT
jgi:hypothetical protein